MNKAAAQERFRPPSIGLIRRFYSYLGHHWQAMVWAFRHFFGAFFSHIATIVVIAFVLALPLSLFVLLNSAQAVVGHGWQKNQSITLLLVDHLTPEATQAFVEELNAMHGVAKTRYISPQAGLAELSQKLGLVQPLVHLDKNPLPGVIEVIPDQILAPPAFQALVARFQSQPQVNAVQTDQGWAKQFYGMMTLGQRLLLALALVLCLGIVLIVGNTVRLMLKEHAIEQRVLCLLGATPAYIRRPLLYWGMILGALGSLLACAFVLGLSAWLAAPLAALSALYDLPLRLLPLSVPLMGFCLAGGALLGLLGARFNVNPSSQFLSR